MMLALDGRAVIARSAMTEWVVARLFEGRSSHPLRPRTAFAATSPIEGEDA
jgi:hypothetical protein